MNAIDRIVGYFSPQAGLSRVRARAALGAVNAVRRYEGAGHDRQSGDWHAGQSSANSEIAPDLSTLIARSHDLVRNNPFADKASRVWVNNTVGPYGILPQLEGDHSYDFLHWSDECDPELGQDIAGQVRLISGAAWESGAALVRLVPRRLSDGLHVPFQIQIIEPDFIDRTKNDDVKGGGRIVNGVEYDRFNRRVAYWLFKGHPGDHGLIGRFGHQSTRVPASQILHIYRRLRPGQTHGVPMLASSLKQWRHVANYETAVDQRKAIEACMSAFVTGGEPDQVEATLKALGMQSDDSLLEGLLGKDLVGMLEPGAIIGLPGNLKVEAFAPPASEDVNFLRHRYRGLAAGAGTTDMQMTGDLSQANYSSMRAGLIEARLDFRTFQQELAHQAVRPILKSVFTFGRLAGRFRGMADSFRPALTFPVFESIDPLKDVMADLAEVRAGFKTVQQAQAERGNEHMQVIQAFIDHYKKVDKDKLIFDSDPRHTSKNGGMNNFAVEEATKTDED